MNKKLIPHDSVVISQCYHVKFEDCCVKGSFTARVVAINVEYGGGVSDKDLCRFFQFDNGVRIEGHGARFYEC